MKDDKKEGEIDFNIKIALPFIFLLLLALIYSIYDMNISNEEVIFVQNKEKTILKKTESFLIHGDKETLEISIPFSLSKDASRENRKIYDSLDIGSCYLVKTAGSGRFPNIIHKLIEDIVSKVECPNATN